MSIRLNQNIYDNQCVFPSLNDMEELVAGMP